MILVDHQIAEKVRANELAITNFDPDNIQPASYDLRIGSLIYAPSQPEKPIDMAANGGAYRLPPYGAAVVTTHEDLRLPNNMVGRIGLKSGFARTGLFASTGPQIDPGFNGKLFVSLFNLTAASHVLKYRDTFLTIEFHLLNQLPHHGYDGPYQGKYTIGPEVMESLVRLEGLTLSQMQSQFSDLAAHVEKWSAFASKVDLFLETMNKYTRAIQDLINQPRIFAEAPNPAIQREIEARKITVEEAASEILALFEKKKTLFYSDISEELHLSLGTIISACELLQKRNMMEGASNGKTGTKKTRHRNP